MAAVSDGISTELLDRARLQDSPHVLRSDTVQFTISAYNHPIATLLPYPLPSKSFLPATKAPQTGFRFWFSTSSSLTPGGLS